MEANDTPEGASIATVKLEAATSAAFGQLQAAQRLMEDFFPGIKPMPDALVAMAQLIFSNMKNPQAAAPRFGTVPRPDPARR